MVHVHGERQHGEDTGSKAAVVTDPVCGMDVIPAEAAGSAEHGGTTYWFCNPSCRDKFVADPAPVHGAGGRSAGGALSRAGERRPSLHLPDAPRGPPAGPGKLPDLRDGAGAAEPLAAEEGPTRS